MELPGNFSIEQNITFTKLTLRWNFRIFPLSFYERNYVTEGSSCLPAGLIKTFNFHWIRGVFEEISKTVDDSNKVSSDLIFVLLHIWVYLEQITCRFLWSQFGLKEWKVRGVLFKLILRIKRLLLHRAFFTHVAVTKIYVGNFYVTNSLKASEALFG